jgi:glycosyltransferase involved in cell wall biosynthesis/predicted SAM-dependent methyltransferase/cephalosporin hydroxylase
MTKKTLAELYETHTGKVSDKWSLYLTEYDRIFSPYRDEPIRLLEIGIQNGGSLEIWSKYFGYATKLVGCDINPDCVNLTYEDQRVSVVIGDANRTDVHAQILDRASSFDIIIDDGSHTSADIIKSFTLFFPKLTDGGIFVAEDLHCSYWSEFEGGLFNPYSSMAFFKRLSDVLNYQHWGIDRSAGSVLQSFFSQYHCILSDEEIARIHSVEFVNSMCVIRKMVSSQNGLGTRVIAGVEEPVVTGHHVFQGQASAVLRKRYEQSTNRFSTRLRAPDETIEEIEAELRAEKENQDILRSESELEQQHVAELDAVAAKHAQQIAHLTQSLSSVERQNEDLKRFAKEARDALENNDDLLVLQHTSTRLQGEVDALRSSTSWKITRPMRVIGHQIKRARQAIRLVRPAVEIGGGYASTAQKALKLYRKEGFIGIKKGFRHVAKGSEPPAPAPGSGAADRNDYGEWVRRYDTLTDIERQNMSAHQNDFVARPLMSVVMPTYNPRPEWLIEAIESVRKQIYPVWELCIADDASSDAEVLKVLKRYQREDSRIKVVFREKNGHISVATNSALECVTGQWVVLLDHDDLLSEHALFWVVDCINANPSAQMIYSDEDKIDGLGNRSGPYFKSDWNVDLFYSHNMFSHLGVYRTDLVRTVGGFRKGMEGAQDYDLALRCFEKIAADQIKHVPRVLYHWRVHSESTASSADAKPYAMIAGEQAINQHFEREGVSGRVNFIGFGYQASYELPAEIPQVSVIIPTRNGSDLLRKCIESISKKTTYPNFEIIIIDNGSDDEHTLDYLRELMSRSRISVIRDERPFNFSALNNVAAAHANGSVLALINDDIEVITPNWLTEMVSHALRPDIGAVGAKLRYPNDRIQHGGVVLGVGGMASHAHKGMVIEDYGYFGRATLIQNFSAVTAACLVVRKDLYLEVGGLNEVELAIGYNDVDFCLKLREAGYRNLWTPLAELYHHESASRGADEGIEKRIRLESEQAYMRMRWGSLINNDPAYSPNLTLDYDDFSYAWPPRVKRLPLHSSLTVWSSTGQPVDRISKTLYFVDRKGRGLEIGPSHAPMTPKKAGFNVEVLDHATAEQLRIKYTGHSVNIDNIEEVDHVWRGEPLSQLIGRESCYDWIVASHVIEHVTDLICFLQECEKLLADDGVLSLVIPDKRYCFDYFRWPSSTGNALQAFHDKRIRHSPGTIFDHFSTVSKLGNSITWTNSDTGEIKFIHSDEEAEEYWRQAIVNSHYIDSHSWIFTPSSFRLILADLQRLGLTGLVEVGGFPTVGFEFWITLGKRTTSPVIYDRQALAEAMVREVAEEVRCMQ